MLGQALVQVSRNAGDNCEEWPWLHEEGWRDQIKVAAEVLSINEELILGDETWPETLHIER